MNYVFNVKISFSFPLSFYENSIFIQIVEELISLINKLMSNHLTHYSQILNGDSAAIQ